MDQQANLVVIELKRTQDGGHMELQGIRYAAMVSAVTFERAAEIHAEFLARIGEPREEAQARMLAFLNWDEPDEESFATDVRILLVSEDFGKELTTAVLWLRDREIDIRCIRLRPYQDGEARLIDVQQIIPLPEVQDYQVQLRKKERVERKQRAERDDVLLRFWQGLVAIAHDGGTRHGNRKPGPYPWLEASAGFRGMNYQYRVMQEYALIELYIDCRNTVENKRIFDAIHAQKDEIEQRFGDSLLWARLDDKQASRIKYKIEQGGYRTPEAEWTGIHQEMVTAMSRLEAALQPSLDELRS